ncbi:MAG: phosphotransferase [Clostridiales bacterium]|nr:phosphotransferase [Clostridiales bacterium]
MELKHLISTSETVDIYKEGNMAIKLFKEGCPKTMALYESLTHSRVEATGLRVPVIHEVSVIGSRWAIHMDCIEGKTLAEMMKEDPANLDRYLSDMVDIQIEIHSKHTPKLSKLKDKMSRQINSLDCIDDATRYELLTRLDSRPKHVKLCHGNFSPENIIINDKGTYVVDWVAARQGNASADVGRTYLLLSLSDPDMAEKYLNLFCERTSTSKKYVQEWLPIVAAAQLTEHKPEERELLMKWVSVVAYE